MNNILCQCGCGHKAKAGNRFIFNHHMRGKPFSEQHRKNHKEACQSQEFRIKVSKATSKAVIGKPKSEKHRLSLSMAQKRNWQNVDYRNKQPPPPQTLESIRKRAEKNKEHWKNADYKNKMSQIHKQQWKNSDFAQRQMQARNVCPNKAESFLDLFNKKLHNGFIFVGDGRNKDFILGGKVPDFVNPAKKKVIELYGDYWHRGQDPQLRINHFKNYGFDCLVVWEHELKDVSTLKIKLEGFHGKSATCIP